MSESVILDDYVSSEGKLCRICGQPLDTKTTITMLCSSCKHKEWAKQQHEAYKAKYGIDNPMQDRATVDKIKATMIQKYGANCAMNVPEFRKKFEDTCKARYGTSYYVNSAEFVNKSSCKSKINEEFGKLLDANNIEAEVEKEYDDKRFDFRLKNKQIFIEIDPTYTHNSAGNHWDTEGQPNDKQLIKTLIAEKHNYRCIHVFDWDNWDDIIDLIKDRPNRVYARKCSVRLIEDKSYNEFIDTNHIQKNCKGTKIAIGLYDSNEDLVQVMTFGTPRYNKNYRWELLRLCSRKDTEVIGGASKLFSYATHELNLTSIISYCDRSKFKGDVYTKIGMKLLRQTSPQEIWSKKSDKITGSLLRQRGYDQLFNANYGKGTSNEKLMLENGWLPVFDCGQLVFTYGDCISEEINDENNTNNIDYNSLLKSIDKSKEKICEFCGEPFVPRSNFQRYCKRPHYMNCPICGKQYLVTNNENLKRPPVACSYECRTAKREQTSMERYGIKAPGNNPEARAKTRAKMIERYGAEYSLKAIEPALKAKETMKKIYGVDNINKIKEVADQIHKTRNENWKAKVHEMLPIKFIQPNELRKCIIDDTKMQIYILTEKASTTFLKEYGFNIVNTFRKIHLSIGLVDDGILYQVIRFERKPNNEGIILADFGTRMMYYNPNGYRKLMQFATEIRSIDSFTAEIPRWRADDITIKSLMLEKTDELDYKVYWKVNEELKELTQQHDIEEMLNQFDYITTDYIDRYMYKHDSSVSPLENIQFITQGETLS